MGAGVCLMGMRLVCCWVGGHLRLRRDNSEQKGKNLSVSVRVCILLLVCVYLCVRKRERVGILELFIFPQRRTEGKHAK